MITYRTRSENYYTTRRIEIIIERRMKRKILILSIIRDEGLCE